MRQLDHSVPLVIVSCTTILWQCHLVINSIVHILFNRCKKQFKKKNPSQYTYFEELQMM